ncbi:hypothetical protein [Massilia yuzhufengensis]|uniref:hypothetical protein n=1 Tax=Massilia yuzhufengensis TaxID=1164594 RepID=UPI000AE86191|nr:hypothetical protein [Massilia yuzhufengensis]
MTVSLSTYYRITRMSALYDLLVTAPFATPWTFALVYPLLSHANVALGGAAPGQAQPGAGALRRRRALRVRALDGVGAARSARTSPACGWCALPD